MYTQSNLSCAIAAILGTSAAGLAGAALAADADSSDAIQEITVTAQRRTENLQNVPISIQALTAETLSQLNVTTFDDYVKYLPNVTNASWGPGQSLIFMRGLSAGQLGTQGTGSTGNFPNVAVYLDEQSSQLPSRNLDIYAADLERIEVLEGPQGTLFGAGAEAGAVRYITNKPKLDVTEGSVDAGYGYTSHGDPNSSLEAVLNVPLISDTLAVRAVIYDDHRGGYINNVASSFTRQNSDLGIGYAGGSVPANSTVINNAALVQNAINPVSYEGMRLSALWKIDDNWNALLSQTYQSMDAEGVFFQMPVGSEGQTLPDLSVTQFNPSYYKDKFENTALTINGTIGALKAVYAGGYLVRNIENVQDYTNYARGPYADFYQCTSGASASGTRAAAGAACYSPSATWQDTVRSTHQSHEIRISTPDDWQLRILGGAFWEQFEIYDQTNFNYKTLPVCSATVTSGCLPDYGPPPGVFANDPNLRSDNTGFFDDLERGYRQYAFFGSVDYDLIPKTLTLTAGTRYFNFLNTEQGSAGGGFGVSGVGLNGVGTESATSSGFKSRANLTWHVTPDAMVYYTWSQGYRPGGFNRSTAAHVPINQITGKLDTVNGVDEYQTPLSYAPDTLINNELGVKTEWFDHRLEFNGAIYQEDWKNVQVAFFDPAGGLGNLTFNTNGANYQVRGLESSVVARVTHGLTIQAAASWNRTQQTNSPYLIGNIPGTLDYGKPITGIANPYGTLGSPLAQSPPFQGNIRARYEWAINSYQAFVQFGGQRQAHSLSLTGNSPSIAPTGSVNQAFDQPGYTTYDGSIGVSKDAWNVQVYGQNLTDTRALTFISSSQAIETETVMRPRVVGLKFGYKF
jgi:outer membrane receptor protein involved in Fe transport